MPTTNPDYQPPIGDATIPPTGVLVPPGSPKADSLTARTYTSGYTFVHTITSTTESLNGTGENVGQQGAAAISNVAAVSISGISQGALQVFRWS